MVWLAGQCQLRGDALTQWTILERSGIDQTAWLQSAEDEPELGELPSLIAEADWIVDGLLGTGLARPVRGGFAAVIEAVNRSGKPVLALDLPSGLDCDTGLPLGIAIRACATATFAAPKLGFAQPGVERYTGEVRVIDIGLPRAMVKRFLI
jgi:NAD(P)H-hydrate epimerase